MEDITDWFNQLDRNYSLPKISTYSQSYLDGDKLLLIDIADLHLNLQASMFITGNEYNCNIAEKLFFYVIEDIISRTSNRNFAKIIFCVGGDMLNADNIAGTTTKGTPQNNDLHLFEAYERLCAMTIKAIETLKDIAPVKVIYVPGNHDLTCGFKLALYINSWFRNEERVNVDYSPLPRKYFVFGKTLFTFAHDGNIKTLPKTIADEARAYWSDVDTVEVFLQHLHGEAILLEDNNMRIQRLPTISAKSEWSVFKGYNSKRQCKTFIYDKEDGLTDVLYTPIKTK
jgi:UDP-2,3-diacylglucosamine pyrophosphatase LpxH